MTSLELSLSRKQVSLLLPYKQNKPQSLHYANQRGKEQFSCVKGRTVLQAKSWEKSQELKEERLASSHLCNALDAIKQGGSAAGTVMGKVGRC